MHNRIILTGKLLDAPKIRSFERSGEMIEVVSLWLEVKDEHRTDRFTVEINCPRAGADAKAMKPNVIAEVTGALRHDRWKEQVSGKWTGKVYIAIDPGEGTVRSKGLASSDEAEAA
jgi:hypothetical protein